MVSTRGSSSALGTGTTPGLPIPTPAASVTENAKPNIKFTSTQALYSQVARASGDILIITDISPDVYNSISRRERRFHGIRLRRYYAITKILIVTIPTTLHEVLHTNIQYSFIAKVVRLNLEGAWEPTGCATFRSEGHPNGDGGEGDSTGCPFPTPPGRKGWPTLVIESGHSESMEQLRNDVKWWFQASDHEVKIILLAKFDHHREEILLEKYEEELYTRPGATMTRAASRPVRRQSISISRNTATNPPTYNVTSGTLSLSFRLLFLRDPDPTRGEGDFVWTLAEMEQYAERVWLRV
ncbi:hypothetical protein GGR54DRAFT_631107 [Hypoxylon sp. NC1633]|nr:hypothetical protein GGR54DRAFT_631107 [Hypoxylon sp. NC1633]